MLLSCLYDAWLITATPTPLHLRRRILDLLVYARRFHDLVKVLHADIAARTHGRGCIVCPDCRVDTPALAIPLGFELVVDVEATQENDLAAGFA